MARVRLTELDELGEEGRLERTLGTLVTRGELRFEEGRVLTLGEEDLEGVGVRALGVLCDGLDGLAEGRGPVDTTRLRVALERLGFEEPVDTTRGRLVLRAGVEDCRTVGVDVPTTVGEVERVRVRGMTTRSPLVRAPPTGVRVIRGGVDAVDVRLGVRVCVRVRYALGLLRTLEERRTVGEVPLERLRLLLGAVIRETRPVTDACRSMRTRRRRATRSREAERVRTPRSPVRVTAPKCRRRDASSSLRTRWSAACRPPEPVAAPRIAREGL